MNIGIKEENRNELAQGISSVLADTYALYLKTQNFHWNVTGPRFHQLHAMFEEHYTEMAEAIDEIAERMRALGFLAPGSFTEFQKLTSISEDSGAHKADVMVEKLVDGHENVIRKSREVVSIASEVNDEASADLMTSRIKTHEKMAWMLRSLLH